MYIAPGITSDNYIALNLDDPQSPNWTCAIEIFRQRICARYIEPADLLMENDSRRKAIERRYGFRILALDCLLIETLQSFRDGLTDTKYKSKKMFERFLSGSESFRKHFTKKEAATFFYDFRCGILHQAEVMGPWLLWSVGSIKGTKSDGTPYVNRTKMHLCLKDEIERYCKELKDPKNADLRKKFRTKMDFIARKTNTALPSAAPDRRKSQLEVSQRAKCLSSMLGSRRMKALTKLSIK
jgi:hypothetical protein